MLSRLSLSECAGILDGLREEYERQLGMVKNVLDTLPDRNVSRIATLSGSPRYRVAVPIT